MLTQNLHLKENLSQNGSQTLKCKCTHFVEDGTGENYVPFGLAANFRYNTKIKIYVRKKWHVGLYES